MVLISVVPEGRGSTLMIVTDRVQAPALWSPFTPSNGHLTFCTLDILDWSGGPGFFWGTTTLKGPSPSSVFSLLRTPVSRKAPSRCMARIALSPSVTVMGSPLLLPAHAGEV